MLARSKDEQLTEVEQKHNFELAVRINLPVADSLARRYRSRGVDLEDLVQVARLGLIQAATRFDPDNGSFMSYAVPTITGELKRHFRDHCWTIRPPRRLQELHRDVMAAQSELAQERCHEPTSAEIAERVSVSVDDVQEVMANSTFSAASLDATDGTSAAPKDRLGTIDAELEGVDDKLEKSALMHEVEVACRKLSDEDRRILQLRFGEGRTQAVIAAELGLSQMSVSRRLAKITKTLRQQLRPYHPSPAERSMRSRQATARPRQPRRA